MGPRSGPPVGDEELEKEVQELAAKVSSFREKGIESFARLHELTPKSRSRQDVDHGHIPEGVPMDSEAEETEKYNKKLQSLLDRLTVAKQAAPLLLKELAIWKEKIEQAVETLNKGRHLAFMENEDSW